MKRANLELTIERLLLPDLPLDARARVVAAFERELTRLWSEWGAPPGFAGESLALSAAGVEVPAGTAPDDMGVQVAQSIYGRLAGDSQPLQGPGRSTV